MAAVATSLVLVLLAMMLGADAVWLDMPPTGTKCVSEEIQPNVVVLADYALMYDHHPTSHPTVAVKVSAPKSPPPAPMIPSIFLRLFGVRGFLVVVAWS